MTDGERTAEPAAAESPEHAGAEPAPPAGNAPTAPVEAAPALSETTPPVEAAPAGVEPAATARTAAGQVGRREAPVRPGPTGPRSRVRATRAGQHRPPWWPESEPWPPRRGTWRGRDWGAAAPSVRLPEASGGSTWAGPPWARHDRAGRHRRPFVRGFGCLFVFLVLLAVAVGGAGAWAVATALGFTGASSADRVIATAGVILGLVVVLGVAQLVRSFTRPVDDLVEAASRVEEGDYSARVDITGPRDVRSLARAFNAMSARLEETDRQRRAYLADVTHELRTPLSVLQGQLEGVIDGIYAPDPDRLRALLEQVRTLDGLIEDLRTLTLVETGGLALRREPVDLGVLINGTAESLRTAAAERQLTVRTDVDPGLPIVDADPVRIRSVLSNLLANAIRHTPAGGAVTVAASADATAVHVQVRDTGPGFPPELLPRVFERFVRSPESSGSGLGLAIARDLVLAHGGTISARNEPGGAVVELSLPRAGGHPAP